jgi:serine/threonine protein kinase
MTHQIAQYRILAELGAGGMGIVYRALDTELQREVAIKRLRSEFAAAGVALERFRNEAKLQGKLNHPNIAQLYSLVQTHDAFCLVMELVDGISLKDLLPLPWRQAAAILIQVLDALGYAHSRGVLHRDIKPENILLDRRGMVKVMDFGIAHAVGTQRMTREKSILGTIEYMAPERILGQPMDGKSDIYALGILLFELVSGRLPFDVATEYDLLQWQLESNPPPVSALADAPASLDDVIWRAMRKNPQERYGSCAEMAAPLRAMVPDLGNANESLRDLTAGRMASTAHAEFDPQECFAKALHMIVGGDTSGTERFLRSEMHRHPRAEALRQYHAVVARAQSQLELATATNNSHESAEMIQIWLSLIAAERAGDRSVFESAAQRMRQGFPDSAVAQMLAP